MIEARNRKNRRLRHCRRYMSNKITFCLIVAALIGFSGLAQSPKKQPRSLEGTETHRPSNIKIPDLPSDFSGFEASRYLAKITLEDESKPIWLLTDRDRKSLKQIVIQVAALAETLNRTDETLSSGTILWKIMALNFPELVSGGGPLKSIQREDGISVVNLGRTLAGRPPQATLKSGTEVR